MPAEVTVALVQALAPPVGFVDVAIVPPPIGVNATHSDADAHETSCGTQKLDVRCGPRARSAGRVGRGDHVTTEAHGDA